MIIPLLIETLVYYIAAGFFCGIVFAEELGLPLTRQNDNGFSTNMSRLLKSVCKYSLLWLPLVVVKTLSLIRK